MIRFNYYVEWSNFEKEGPFPNFFYAMRAVLNKHDDLFFSDKELEEEFFLPRSSNSDREIVYSHTQSPGVGFYITRIRND